MSKAGFDFTGTSFRADVRALNDPDGTLLAQATITADTGTLGIATCVGVLEGTQTAGLPSSVVLEIEVEKSGASWGPYTIARLTINVDRDYAHP